MFNSRFFTAYHWQARHWQQGDISEPSVISGRWENAAVVPMRTRATAVSARTRAATVPMRTRAKVSE